MNRVPPDFEEIASNYKSLYFIHIPKTAGSYVFEIAFKHEIKKISKYDAKTPYMKGKRFFNGGHCVCTSKLLQIDEHNRAWTFSLRRNKAFKQSCVFCLIRNPFDLLVSFYTYGFPYRKPRPSKPKPWLDKIGWPFVSFEDFVKKFCDPEFSWLIPFQKKFLFFQIFDDEGKCVPHFLVRQEYLDEGLKIISKPFGITPIKKNIRIKDSRDNSTRDYKQFYDENLRKIAENKLKRELDAFGYSFDGDDGRIILKGDHVHYNPHTDEFKIT